MHGIFVNDTCCGSSSLYPVSYNHVPKIDSFLPCSDSTCTCFYSSTYKNFHICSLLKLQKAPKGKLPSLQALLFNNYIIFGYLFSLCLYFLTCNMGANNAGLMLLKMNWDNHRWEGWLWWYEEVGSSSLQEKNMCMATILELKRAIYSRF